MPGSATMCRKNKQAPLRNRPRRADRELQEQAENGDRKRSNLDLYLQVIAANVLNKTHPFEIASSEAVAPELGDPSVSRDLDEGLLSYEMLVQQHRRRLHAAACRILRNEADAEEAVQDAHLLALRHLDQFEGRSTFLNWLTKITINEALSRRRRAAGNHSVSLDETPIAIPLTAVGPNPEQQLLDRENEVAVENALRVLPEPYRLVFRLRAFQELSTAETAVALRLTEGCVRTRLLRARTILQRKLSTTFKSRP